MRPTVRVDRRVFLGALAAIAGAGAGCYRAAPFPAEDTPEGAYARITMAISEGRPRDIFAFLEDEAQWAAHTIRKERVAAVARARATYPPEELKVVEANFGADAAAADGADVFLGLAKSRGWISRLRRDLSGIASVERDGERVTVVTARGSRYAMRRRKNGIYGLTMFTAELLDGAEKATRDRARIDDAARDFSSVLNSGGGGSDAAAD